MSYAVFTMSACLEVVVSLSIYCLLGRLAAHSAHDERGDVCLFCP